MEPGQRAEITVVVGAADTAAALGSGTVLGLGTVERVMVDREKFLAHLL